MDWNSDAVPTNYNKRRMRKRIRDETQNEEDAVISTPVDNVGFCLKKIPKGKMENFDLFR